MKNTLNLFKVNKEKIGQRLDNYIIREFKKIPKSFIYRIIRIGKIRLNGNIAKAKTRLQNGDQIKTPKFLITMVKKVYISDKLKKFLLESVIAESNDWLVINKPCGISVHGGSKIKIGLIEAIKQARKDIDFIELVHRLDKDTSGCLLLAKSRTALLLFNKAFKNRKIEKCYIALVYGHWPISINYVTASIKRFNTLNGEYKMQINQYGKYSFTLFKICKFFYKSTLIKALPITGRTHQIRVHAAHVGNPILGDKKYYNNNSKIISYKLNINRLFLHAGSIKFPDPTTGKIIHVKAKIDPVLKEFF
ncbi:Ribosomal large subunit pseudouridine synthase C [Candidatus Johnevansia muelleri]|uniref:Pseudouridine synthase n=1 Tax=Candidatus Johnevansia muelleri TaxID=1495769 RepID=A0A078KHK6_9GAMM|nr:Ribosomal large subunit pseudouridine synthase C [Candidatus Evansia muelleri]